MKTGLAVMAALGLLLAFAGGGIFCGQPSGTPPALNVLLITLDTTRADRLGCYGYGRPTSPNLDKLAKQATVFDLAVAQAAVTPVSHASILTGREPYNHGLRVMHGLVENSLEEGQTSLAEVWRTAGGETAAFISAYPVSAAFGLDQGFEHFDEDFPQADGEGLVSPQGTINTGMSQRRADATTEAAITWLREHQDRDKPLLMWAHYFDPHDPNVAPPDELMGRLLNGKFQPASHERADVLRGIYDCEISFMDGQLGRLFNEFKQQGLWEQTVVVVVADHGEGLGDHDWWTHGILYQEQIRVPMILRVPGISGGERVPALVRTTDLMPTILEVSGVDRRHWPEMDGQTLSEALHTGDLSQPRSAYSESVNILNYRRPDNLDIRDEKSDKFYCMIDGRHKLIYHQLERERIEFYDLWDDPGELKNLAGLSPRPAAMDTLLDRLETLDVFSDIMPGMTATDLERLRRLRSLGYIQ